MHTALRRFFLIIMVMATSCTKGVGREGERLLGADIEAGAVGEAGGGNEGMRLVNIERLDGQKEQACLAISQKIFKGVSLVGYVGGMAVIGASGICGAEEQCQMWRVGGVGAMCLATISLLSLYVVGGD